MRIMFLRHRPRGEKEASTEETVLSLLRSYARPDTDIDMHYPADFPGSQAQGVMASRNVLNGLYHTLEAPGLVRKAVEARAAGYDAVVQGNSFEPGVEASRLAVDIPVVGPLKTSLHVAATLADKIGLTVPLDGHVPYVRRLVEAYGFGRALAGVRAMGVYKGATPDQVTDSLEKRAKELVSDDGAQIIIPLGAAMIPYVVRPESIQERVGYPVINTVSTAIGFAEMLVARGMRHSELAYPFTPLAPEDVS